MTSRGRLRRGRTVSRRLRLPHPLRLRLRLVLVACVGTRVYGFWVGLALVYCKDFGRGMAGCNVICESQSGDRFFSSAKLIDVFSFYEMISCNLVCRRVGWKWEFWFCDRHLGDLIFMRQFIIILALSTLLSVCTANISVHAATIYFGATPYFSTADVPAGLYGGGSPVGVEDFESHSFFFGMTLPP